MMISKAKFLMAGALFLSAGGAWAITNTETKMVAVGDYRLPAWKSDTFQGTTSRTYDDPFTSLKVEVDSASGGFDAGVAKYSGSQMVDEMPTSLTVTSTVVPQLVSGPGGRWWIGPKTIISKTPGWVTLSGNYECYIIENSNVAPDELIQSVGGTNKQYHGETIHDGSAYKHYSLDFKDFRQVWSIRQNYRAQGATSVGQILRDWRFLGLTPNWYSLGWKSNIEFGGPNKGTVVFSDYDVQTNNKTEATAVVPAPKPGIAVAAKQ